jgi:hypothetical protein
MFSTNGHEIKMPGMDIYAARRGAQKGKPVNEGYAGEPVCEAIH